MTSFSDQNNDTKLIDERLAQAFYAGSRFNAAFLGITGIGFVVIYLLTYFNLLGKSSPPLLYIAGAIFILALLQIPASNLARNKRGIAANFLGAFSIIIFAVMLTAFWQGVTIISLLLIFVTPATAFMAGMPRKYYSGLILAIGVGFVSILYVNANPPIERLQNATSAAIASLAFLATVGALLITVTIVARSRRYRTLRNQLLTSFIIIVTIPTLLAIVLSTVGAYVNNETQVLNILKTVSKLKENQINNVINGFKVDAVRIREDNDFFKNAITVLAPGQTSDLTQEISRRNARNHLIDFLDLENNIYSEIMVLNIRGVVVISTNANNENLNLQPEMFYREGSLGDFAGFSDNPAFGDSDLIYATPLYTATGGALRGILVLRANPQIVKDILESTPSFPEMETYILNQDSVPLTKIRYSAGSKISTQASESIFPTTNVGDREGDGVYVNYAGTTVLGYYKRFDVLENTAVIAEIPRDFVLQSSIRSLLSSSALAAFAILIAIAAVVISAESIATPISTLADTAGRFAAGQLSARALIERRDEIGALSKSYNQMAEQLQDIIGKLEQRVTDRTRELEDQTLRLRASAEIARDAASSHNLYSLLEKAGSLIQERFKVYHTGIFLFDSNREFAVLAASPTDAGREMIANNHKLRVGEVGIVGRVAATGDPRISLDTGSDAVHFNNPLLPLTRSEMALPLKVENKIIGVLDVQSDQPQAFDSNDIAIMQILADQLATAIERTRLLEQVEQNLQDLEQAYGRFTREGWKTLGESGLLNKIGYRFDNIRIQSISDVPELGDEVMSTGSLVTRNSKDDPSGNNLVAIPIKLRGQTIGVVSANLREGYTKNTISTLELAIERLAQSLESARLYEQASLRANREQTIAQVAANISSASEFDAILRTTVEEIGRSLGDAEVSIQIITDR